MRDVEDAVPYMGKKNMERKTGQRGAQKAPLWKHPRCGKKKTIVPYNQIRNLRVHASISAQDAAAFWRLFVATGIFPRSYRVVGDADPYEIG